MKTKGSFRLWDSWDVDCACNEQELSRIAGLSKGKHEQYTFLKIYEGFASFEADRAATHRKVLLWLTGIRWVAVRTVCACRKVHSLVLLSPLFSFSLHLDSKYPHTPLSLPAFISPSASIISPLFSIPSPRSVFISFHIPPKSPLSLLFCITNIYSYFT